MESGWNEDKEEEKRDVERIQNDRIIPLASSRTDFCNKLFKPTNFFVFSHKMKNSDEKYLKFEYPMEQ